MNAAAVRRFLLQGQRATTVRLRFGDRDDEDLKVGKQSLAKLAETIVNLGPELIECLDAEGKIMRAIRTEPVEVERASHATVPVELQQNRTALLITHFANLLDRAYANSNEVAFTKLVELVERMNDRSDAIEQRLERAEARNRRIEDERLDDAYDRLEQAMQSAADASAANGGSPNDAAMAMMQAFMGGMFGRQPAAAGAPNGKGS